MRQCLPPAGGNGTSMIAWGGSPAWLWGRRRTRPPPSGSRNTSTAGRAQRGGGGLYVGGATFGVSVGTKIGVKIAAGIGAEGFVSLEKEEKK